MGKAPAISCRLCRSDSESVFHAKVLRKYDVGYYRCNSCGFLQTESPFWLEEAYSNPINLTDTGIMARNLQLASTATAVLAIFFNPRASYVDYGGGYGIFTRLMRDAGFDYSWHDPHTQNLLARGFEYRAGKIPVELVSTFESFEHFAEPLQDLEKILGISRNILFSTEILSEPIPAPGQWWYYGLEHGQHISFYGMSSLDKLARRYGLNFYSDGKSQHLFTEKRINPILFKFVLKMARRGLSVLIRKGKRSLTFSDMETLISRNAAP